MMPETRRMLGRVMRLAVLLAFVFAVLRFLVVPLVMFLSVGQHPILEAFRQYVISNLNYIIGVVSVLGVAFVCTMPAKLPGLPIEHPLQEWWTWLRDGLQTAVPAARARNESHSSSTINTPTSSAIRETAVSTAATPDPSKPQA